MKQANLTQELLSAGATEREARELAQIASGLSRLKGTEPALATKPRPWWRPRLGLWSFLGTAVVGLAAGTAVFAIAQTSIPGNWLYPVKRASERITVMTQPDYRTTIMMRRAQEVKLLVAQKRSSRLVTTTLAEYETDVHGLKTKNYAALNYCHACLQQAEAAATPAEKQQISAVLDHLGQDTD